MDRYILPGVGKLPVRQVDAATLDAFYPHLRIRGGKDGRPPNASTVHEVHAVLAAGTIELDIGALERSRG